MKPELHPSLLLAALFAVAGCGSGSDDDDSFILRTTGQAAETGTPPVVAGSWMVYFARESFTGPTGTDLNGDGLKDDQVAFAVNLGSSSETNLMVAARGAAIIGNEIYLKVVEAEDGVDWGGTVGTGDTVLLHWSSAAGAVTFVDTLDISFAAELPVAVGTRLFYTAAPQLAPGIDETTLRRISASAPTTVVTVLNQAGGGALEAHLYGARAGLVFAFADENDALNDLNGDGDTADENVLALLDGTIDGGRLVNVGLALQSDVEPLAARSTATSDWVAAFLVDEASQGASLNDLTLLDGMGNPVFTQAIVPSNCVVNDTDTMDQVLHYLDFGDFQAGTAGARNTGLAGHDRVLVASGFVATLSDEGEANCDLNDDGDTDDDVARWVEIVGPGMANAPEVSSGLMHAIASGTFGGSLGLALLGTRLVAVIDEEADDDDFDTQSGEAVPTTTSWPGSSPRWPRRPGVSRTRARRPRSGPACSTARASPSPSRARPGWRPRPWGTACRSCSWRKSRARPTRTSVRSTRTSTATRSPRTPTRPTACRCGPTSSPGRPWTSTAWATRSTRTTPGSRSRPGSPSSACPRPTTRATTTATGRRTTWSCSAIR
jgi:hypothetical protein